MNQMLRFGLILGLICAAATLVLAVTYEVTKPKIEDQLKKEESAALAKVVMPGADTFTEKTLDGVEYLEAFKNKRLVGYCIRATGTGYSGYIRMLVGIDLSSTIKGVSILEHSETPGLGAKINEVRPKEEEPYFLRQFKGKQAYSIELKKDVDAITGATISSKAVSDAIRDTVNKFLAKMKDEKGL
ncbi:MAG: hypothetical protein A2987_02835 [Omnitrophica bacterium RIFCSPLOWO2_01_FULL_45_10]|nr:MAG: hypothetical protein A2987_02835 [Omnitrophica bacterium RIFCSPLOWO2_01_FULL_45_10]